MASPRPVCSSSGVTYPIASWSLRAYQDGGDRGLRDWMKEFFDDKYVAGWDFVTIDDLGIGTPE